MSAMRDLVRALRDPASVAGFDGPRWSALLSVARAEVLLGTLAHRLKGTAVPERVRETLDAAFAAADQAQRHALWEAEMVRRALAPLGIVPVLLKGTAYAAAGLGAAKGRQIGDCDILVPRDRLPEVEAALIDAGWEWVKDDPYDQSYYREHMHELPPLIHRERDRMIDVHHTILPLTHRARPDSAALLADAVPVGDGMAALSPLDRIIHCAAHLIADGELDGGLRNLWDLHCLMMEQTGEGGDKWAALDARAFHHGLQDVVRRAARLTHFLFATPVDPSWIEHAFGDPFFLARLLARDDWGRERRRGLRLAFYMRSHWMRMPPVMLAKHLWTKSRR